MDQKTDIKKGIFFAFITSIISGVAIFYSKISLAKLPPLILTTSRNSFVGLLFVIYFLIFGKFDQLKNLKKKDRIYLFLIGLIGGSLPFYLFFTGLSMTTPVVGNLIHKTLFIWVAILAYFFLKEKFSPVYFISFLLIFIANFIISAVKPTFGAGESMILLATVFWSVENIIAKKVLSRVSAEAVGLFRMVIGGATLFFISLINGQSSIFLTMDLWQLTIILVGGSILFGYVFFWYKALKYAPASLVSLVLTFSVVVGNILNGSFANLKILPKDIYSSILIFAASGLIFFQIFFKKLKKGPSLIKVRPQTKDENE